jgi:glutaredoxin
MPRHDSMIHRSLMIAALAAAVLTLCAVKAEAGCSKSVTLYSASWCPYCAQVRAILARNNIKYSLLDATTARVQAQMVRRFGDTAVPRTVIGGVVVEGVDEARIKQLCRADAPTGRSVTTPELPPLPRGAGTQVAAAAIASQAEAVH